MWMGRERLRCFNADEKTVKRKEIRKIVQER